MIAETELTGSLQRHILGLLLWSDEHCTLVKNSLPETCFTGDVGIKELVKLVYWYIGEYHEAPKDHTEGLIDELVLNSDKKQALLKLLHQAEIELSQMNVPYVISCLKKFYRQSTLKTTITKVQDLLDAGKVDEADGMLVECLNARPKLFKSGHKLSDGIDYLLERTTQDENDECVFLGIPALDERRLVPARKKMFLFAAPLKFGKTWFFVHVGKRALIENKKVLHITFEMPWEEVETRYVMSLFSAALYPEDRQGRVSIRNTAFDVVDKKPQIYLSDENALMDLAKQISRSRFMNDNLLVEEFPNKTMTVQNLIAFLDELESTQNFVPDVVILDQADNMKVKAKDEYRIELGTLYGELKGLAQSRNFMLVTGTQINRAGKSKDVSSDDDVAEDYSKGATADIMVTYSQKELEYEVGIARLNVAAARNAKSRFQVLIAQDYSTGQFILESVVMDKAWKDLWTKLMKNLNTDEDQKK